MSDRNGYRSRVATVRGRARAQLSAIRRERLARKRAAVELHDASLDETPLPERARPEAATEPVPDKAQSAPPPSGPIVEGSAASGSEPDEDGAFTMDAASLPAPEPVPVESEIRLEAAAADMAARSPAETAVKVGAGVEEAEALRDVGVGPEADGAPAGLAGTGAPDGGADPASLGHEGTVPVDPDPTETPRDPPDAECGGEDLPTADVLAGEGLDHDRPVSSPDRAEDGAASASDCGDGVAASVSRESRETDELAPPERKGSDLHEIPGIGSGLVWMLQSAGVSSLAELARADTTELAGRLGMIARLLDLDYFVDHARQRLPEGDRR